MPTSQQSASRSVESASNSSGQQTSLLVRGLVEGDWIHSVVRQVEETMEIIAEELAWDFELAVGHHRQATGSSEQSSASLDLGTDEFDWGV